MTLSINKLKNDILSFNKSEKIFLLSAMFCAFLISFDYAIVRPASVSLFISNFSAKIFPYAWIFGIPINFLVIYLYNKFLPRFGPLKTFLGFCLAVILINALTAFFTFQMIFIQYIWKDVYILLAFKQIWSMIHSNYTLKKSKYLYGFIFGVGGSGGIIGGLISGFFASFLGSQKLLLLSFFIYGLIFLLYFIAFKNSSLSKQEFNEAVFPNAKPLESLNLIKKSSLLTFLLLIVVFMQMSAALIDYQFNFFLEKAFEETDLRTQYYGKLISVINTLTTILQFVGGMILINILGIKRSHLMIPLILGINSIMLIFVPSFGLASFAFASIKILDFSIFGVLRELLYAPLKIDEKYRAKAIIDVFAYRSAKAIPSLFLIVFQSVIKSNVNIVLNCLAIVIFIIWIKIAHKVLTKHEHEVLLS